MADQAAEKKDPIYLLTVGYLLALVIIAAMSLCIHVVLGKMVAEQNNAAVVVAARQGHLSQKIAFYATQYAEFHDPVFGEQLAEAIEQMKRAHISLVNGDKMLNIPDHLSPELQRVYFSLPYNLDQKVAGFIEKAEVLVKTPQGNLNRDNADYKYVIETARGPLVTALDAATTEYEAESDERLGKLQSYQKMALFVIFATLIAEAVLIFRPLVTRVHNYAERLKRLAMTDGLTGVDNSRSFMTKCLKELKRSRRLGKPLCLAILDLDHFKQVNDKHGHMAGDEVLKAFAQFVQRSMRLEDEFARIGGEEFAVLLPHTGLAGAELVAERIRQIIEISPIRYDENRELFITVSIGIAEANPEDADIEKTMEAADKALYKAKQQGRNRIVLSDAYSSAGNVVKLEQSAKNS